jgi:hypothetical protein
MSRDAEIRIAGGTTLENHLAEPGEGIRGEGFIIGEATGPERDFEHDGNNEQGLFEFNESVKTCVTFVRNLGALTNRRGMCRLPVTAFRRWTMCSGRGSR